MYSKIIRTLFSVATADQLHTFSNWLENLHDSERLTDNEYNMLRKIIVPFGDTLMIKLKGELEVDTEEQKRLNKDFVPFIEKEIFNYFLDKTESYRTPEFRCVYDLPLRINLIEANIRKQEIKVYLQRPGLFIGRQGKDIDAIRDIIRIKFEMPECEISLVETHGKFDYSNDFDSYYDFPDI